MNFANVNFLAIVAAAVVAWIFGAVYYGVLGKTWIAALGETMETLKAKQAGKSGLAKAAPFILSFVAELIMAYVLYGLLVHIGTFTVRAGIISGVICWFGFILTTIAVNNAYPGRKAMLTVIDSGHWLGRARDHRSRDRIVRAALGRRRGLFNQSGAYAALSLVRALSHNMSRESGDRARGARIVRGMEETKMAEKIYDVPAEWGQRAFVNDAKYREMYARSLKDPNGFWAEQAKRIDWIKPFSKVKNATFGPGNVSIKWFEDGTLNVAYNCVDRHLAKRGDQVAIIWEGDDPKDDKKITYRQLHADVQKFANVLKARGVKKGDRVTIYLPMIPEATIAMLACARIGAIHSVVFGGFSPDSLAGRIEDCKSSVIITADEGVRGGRKIPLKANSDAAADKAGGVTTILVVRHTGAAVNMKSGRDLYYDDIAKIVPAECPCEEMNAEDPLFILYTSGSTGKPKGVLHTTGGYLVYTSITHQYVFDYHDGDIFWCTADVGWVTGHSYIVYGPLCNGATTLMFEGVPNYPSMSRFWEVVRQAQGHHLLHRAYRDPRADAGGRRAGEEDLARQFEIARHGRRADQSGSVGVVSPRGRRRPLPDRRYLVADRDRRDSDHAAAGRDASSSPARPRGRSSASCRKSSTRKARCRRARPAAIFASPKPGRA